MEKQLATARALAITAGWGIVGGVVLIWRAATVPPLVVTDARLPDSAGLSWTGWALVLAVVGAVTAVIVLLRDDRAVVRVRVGTAVALAALLGLALTWWTSPRPGDFDGALGPRAGYLALAFVALLIGGVLLAISGWLRPASVDESGGRVPGAVLAVALLAVLALTAQLVPRWTAAANTDGVTAPSRVAALPTTLAGRTAWSATIRSTGAAVGTAGGLAVAGTHDLTMLDGATGRERWHYRRWDRVVTGPPVTGVDGRHLALPVRLAGPGTDATRQALVLVFDAVTGRLERAVPTADRDDDGTVGILADLLVYRDEEFGLRAVDRHGKRRWRIPVPGVCGVGALRPSGDGLLAVLRCRGEASLLRLDARGAVRWQHDYTAWDLRLAGSGDRLLVDVLVPLRKVSVSAVGAPVRHEILSMAASTGVVGWRRTPDLMSGEEFQPGCEGKLIATGTTVVVAGCRTGFFDVAGLRLTDGVPLWRSSLPADLRDPSRFGTDAVTSDGFLGAVVGLGEGGIGVVHDPQRRGCQVTVLAADGAAAAPTWVRAPSAPERWCHRVALWRVPGGIVGRVRPRADDTGPVLIGLR